jgi:hypothetical protein
MRDAAQPAAQRGAVGLGVPTSERWTAAMSGGMATAREEGHNGEAQKCAGSVTHARTLSKEHTAAIEPWVGLRA